MAKKSGRSRRDSLPNRRLPQSPDHTRAMLEEDSARLYWRETFSNRTIHPPPIIPRRIDVPAKQKQKVASRPPSQRLSYKANIRKLFTTPAHLVAELPRTLTPPLAECVARGTRREVLHATGKAGGKVNYPRLPKSNVRC